MGSVLYGNGLFRYVDHPGCVQSFLLVFARLPDVLGHHDLIGRGASAMALVETDENGQS